MQKSTKKHEILAEKQEKQEPIYNKEYQLQQKLLKKLKKQKSLDDETK